MRHHFRWLSFITLLIPLVPLLDHVPRHCAAEEPVTIKLTDRIPFGREPIDYFSASSDDAIVRLNAELKRGKKLSSSADQFGYLHEVLRELDVPLESQLLVYSKTARAPDLVAPQKPRAIFFNEDISVAWIPQAAELELSAVDPLKGVNFYTLAQPQPDTKAAGDFVLQFERREQCLACHAGRSSLEVPGFLLRSWLVDRTGKPLTGYSRVTHETAYSNRWGGWYVTAAPSGFPHNGNLLSESDNQRHASEPGWRAARSDLSDLFPVANYPAATSDVVAHLIFDHQMHGMNLLIRTAMEERLGRHSDVEEQLLRYLLFADESSLPVAVPKGKFADRFESRGLKDSQGRRLRDLDLKTRLQKYRLSWLVQHRLFDAIPEASRDRILTRLHHGLTQEPAPAGFEHLASDERRVILAIVAATVPRLPECWAAPGSSE